MASAARLACAALAVALCAAHAALAQEEGDAPPAPLSLAADGARTHEAGSGPQALTLRALSGSEPVAGARLRLELLDAPPSAYCTCGEATTLPDGTFAIEWGSAEAGAMTLRAEAEADGHAPAVGSFALTARAAAARAASASLWVPPLMLEGHDYEGVVVTAEARAQGARILLTSGDPASLEVDREATVHPGDNHAIFGMRALSAGADPVGVYASISGPLVGAESRIYSQNSVPSRLEVIMASNSTVSDEVAAYVFALDANGAPARVASETRVRLEPGGSLEAPREVVIPEGGFYARFAVRVHGDGLLRAHATGLEPDDYAITKARRDVGLRMGVAPTHSGENSHAEYAVWLEEGGRPHSHHGVLVGQVHTDNTRVAGFLPVSAENSESAGLRMRDGVASGRVYTREAGEATITASIPDVGTATARLLVGAAYSANVAEQGEDAAADSGDLEPVPAECAGEPRDAEVDGIRAWVHPSLTPGPARLTVAQYHDTAARGACAEAIKTVEGTEDDDSTDDACPERDGMRECHAVRHPMEADGRRVSLSVSPAGVDYDATVELAQGSMRSFSASFGVRARDMGNYTLAATATNVGTALANFSAALPSPPGHSLRVVPLRVAPGGAMQDVALVSIAGPGGELVGAQKAFGRPVEVTVAGAGLPERTLRVSGDSAAVRAGLAAGTRVTATAAGLERGTAEISIPGVVAGVDLALPRSVHLHEEFPFAMHLVDSLGTPLSLAGETALAASGLDVDWAARRMSAQRPGNITMSVLAEQGAHEASIGVFANALGLDVRASAATARTGAPFRIDVVASAPGIGVDVSSPIPWERVEGSTSIDVTAAVPGTFPVTITASKRGYEPSHETLSVTVEEYAILDVSAAGTDGRALGMRNVTLVTRAHDGAAPEREISLPWRREYRDLSSAEVVFPQAHGSSYALSSVTVNGEGHAGGPIALSTSADTVVRAVYDRSVTVGVEGGPVSGAGAHAYGSRVTLVAGTVEVVPLLVYGVFEGWDGLPGGATVEGNTASFAADGDVSVTALYRQDYTGALAVALAAMAGTAAWTQSRRLGGVSPAWALGEIARRVRARAWNR